MIYLSQFLRDFYEKNDVTWIDIEGWTGIDRKYLINIAAGRRKNPSLRTAARIARGIKSNKPLKAFQ